MPSPNPQSRSELTLVERKRLLEIACAVDRLEVAVFARRRPAPVLVAEGLLHTVDWRQIVALVRPWLPRKLRWAILAAELAMGRR